MESENAKWAAEDDIFISSSSSCSPVLPQRGRRHKHISFMFVIVVGRRSLLHSSAMSIDTSDSLNVEMSALGLAIAGP